MTTVGIATGAGRGMGLACARRLATMVAELVRQTPLGRSGRPEEVAAVHNGKR
jgi:NADP-dependent 3-hydroxy acid dehydrogenase YdfG